MSHPVRIESNRLVLREFLESDLDGCMTIVGDERVTNFLSFDTRSREEHAERLAADIERARSEPRPDYYLAVSERATDCFVGFARIGLDRPRTGELGYAVRADRWGEGFATEACTALLDFAVDELGLHRVQAAIGPDNTASIRVIEKLRFVREGRLRDHVFTNGAWRDSLLYSILGPEWRSQSH